jgi:hypothetical protein
MSNDTERRGRVVNTPASYSVLGFNSRTRDRVSWSLFRGFSQCLQENAGIVSIIWPRPLPSTSLPINRSSITLSFDAIYSELLVKHH